VFLHHISIALIDLESPEIALRDAARAAGPLSFVSSPHSPESCSEALQNFGA